MDVPDKLTIKVTFSKKDSMDSEVIPVLMEQKKKAGFIRTAVFCYIQGISTNRSLPPSEPPGKEVDRKLDEKVLKLDEALEKPDLFK